jgi:predicted phosphodiesterase
VNEIRKALEELGYPRTIRILRAKLSEVGVNFLELGRPVGDFSKQEARVLGRITSRLFGVDNIIDATIEAPCGAETTSKIPVIDTGGEVLVIVLSDLHYGSKTFNFLGETLYDMNTTEEMLNQVVDKAISKAPKKDYSAIVYLLAGDMVDGEEIFPTHQSEIDAAAIDQVAGLTKALWRILIKSSKLFPKVYALCVRGNHGRMSRSASERSNWDNALYQQLYIMAGSLSNSNIDVHVAYGEYMNFIINGWRGHMRHQGVPHDGTAAMRAKLGSWKEMHDYDFMVFGHFHRCGRLGYNGLSIYRNGQLKVGGAFGERLALRDPPEQIVFGISEDRQETFWTVLDWNVEWE